MKMKEHSRQFRAKAGLGYETILGFKNLRKFSSVQHKKMEIVKHNWKPTKTLHLNRPSNESFNHRSSQENPTSL